MAWSEATQPPPTPETARVSNPPGRQSLGRRQCVGISVSTGERCKRPPHRGGTVCILHGGGTPLAKMAAQRMLMSMVEPAAATLMLAITGCEYEWITPLDFEGNPDPTARRKQCLVHEENGCPDWKDRVTAAKTLLSRAGYGEQAKMTLEHKDGDLDSLPASALADEMERLSRDLRKTAVKEIMGASSDTTQDGDFTYSPDGGDLGRGTPVLDPRSHSSDCAIFSDANIDDSHECNCGAKE